MHQVSFGSVLKEARLAKGKDIASVARELRIRQDIIRAMEQSDFDRMPSRGYARNMVIAYARLVGLNAQDMSRMYLDQEYAYQVEQAHRTAGSAAELHRAGSRSSDAGSTGRNPRVSSRDERPSSRRSREAAPDDWSRTPYAHSSAPRSVTYSPQSAHRAQRSAMPQGKYTNLYSAPKNIPNPHGQRNKVIIAVAIVLVIVVLALAFFFSHRPATQTNIPVTGASAASQQQDQSQQATTTTTTETAPTDFTVKYSVADGTTAYIEVYVDGKAQQAADVTGPAEKSFTSSDTIRFVTTETKGVTLTVDDKAVDLTANKSGIVNQTYKFSDILDQWYTDHPNVARPDSSSTSSSSDSSGSSSSSSSDSSSGSSSSSSSSKSSSSSSGSSSKSSSSGA